MADEVKRGPGRPPLANPTAQEPPAKKDDPAAPSQASKEDASKGEKGTNVTYVPREGDPATTTWHGHTFRAGKPTRVVHPELLEAAKTNPWFEVEGHKSASEQPPPDATPTDPESYRRYAIAKINTAPSSAELNAWWIGDEGKRQSLGVGSEDVEYLSKLLVPRMAELKKAEA
jgi:hypothetical protein